MLNAFLISKFQINMLNKSNLTILLIFGIIITSCTKDVDFNQADSIQISPVVVSSLIFFNESSSRFLYSGVEITTVTDSIKDIKILTDQFLVDNLVKAEFLFETTNSINRAFEVKVEFYNDVFELQESFSFIALESPLNEELVLEHTITFEGDKLDALKTTTQIILTLTLLPSGDGSMLDEDSLGEFRLRSIATFYFEIDIST
jgi:hypothetical protein